MSADPFDCIFIEGLQCQAVIGIHPSERLKPQTLRLDLWMHWPISAAARSENIADTLDYQSVSEATIELVQTGQFLLVETLAERLAEELMQRYGIQWLRIRVTKPEAIAAASGVGVMIERGQRPHS
ncbi:MAG TPA: dihydroneopterin aldolase [Halothiobacillus sp.]|nr:dihydroneopterin aldolase [Halothiobacillus sp.]